MNTLKTDIVGINIYVDGLNTFIIFILHRMLLLTTHLTT